MAMEDDYPDAIERMAEAYLGDELGLEKDEKTALKLFKRAAKLGNAAAQYNLGMAYACGYYGVTPDKDKALHWLKQSVKGENSSACLQVGLYYYYTVKTKVAYKKPFLCLPTHTISARTRRLSISDFAIFKATA